MSFVFRRTYFKVKRNILSSYSNPYSSQLSLCVHTLFARKFSEEKEDNPNFINSTILVENGLHVQELPVVVRKLKNLADVNELPVTVEPDYDKEVWDSHNFPLIQAEFKECINYKEVFALLSKCIKITPNIALGAMERIYDLEKNTAMILADDTDTRINMAKGAILDKLLKMIVKTEDTQTILNVLRSISPLMDPHKYKFCDELLLRVIDNKLSIEQLCQFALFLKNNRNKAKYSKTIDKLWVGFAAKEEEINETNIMDIYSILTGFNMSKRIIKNILEQKLIDLWSKIKPPVMQEILNVFIDEKCTSLQSFAVAGRWFYTNIHALDEDSFLDIITKFTRLNYTDDFVEKAVEKYVTLKGQRINSYIHIVGILNYCIQFQIRNEQVLNTCSQYFITKGDYIPHSFLKSFIYPFGLLNFNPVNSSAFWQKAENTLQEKFNKISASDMASIILSFIYMKKHPLELVNRTLTPENLLRINHPDTKKKFHLIDTSLSLECEKYTFPLLPRDHWSMPVAQDARIKNIVAKIKESLAAVSGGAERFSLAVQIPFLYSDDTYLIDIMLHPAGMGSKSFNWKLNTVKNDNTAVLIHLPDHFCSDNKQLIGPQVMRMRHLKLLGMKVVSLKYSSISQLYMSFNNSGLKKYLQDSIDNAEP